MEFPRLVACTQRFPLAAALEDPAAELAARLESSGLLDSLRPGERVAVAVGSRGINALPALVASIVAAVRGRGAEPFIMPAMGSHGGATDEGQRSLLARLGVTEAACGAPVASSMGTVDFGLAGSPGARLVTARDAADADRIVLLNRVKAHTSYKGRVESGLTKMLVVGLGREPGARAFHLTAQRHKFPDFMLELASGLKSHLHLLAGVAVLEDQLGRSLDFAVVPPEDFEQADSRFLASYEALAPRLPFHRADLLIVERMGKDISGTGMDTNVIGRARHLARPEPDRPRISRIWARSLTPASEGNATGIGLADFISARLARAADMPITIKNALNALAPERAFLPPSLEPERLLLAEALRTAGVADPGEARLAWIPDTSHLERLLLSESLAAALDPDCPLGISAGKIDFSFDRQGVLLAFEEHWSRVDA